MRNRFWLFSSANERSHAVLGGSLGLYIGLSFSLCANNIYLPGIIMIVCSTTLTGIVLGNGVGRGVDAAIKLEENIDVESDLEAGLPQNDAVRNSVNSQNLMFG